MKVIGNFEFTYCTAIAFEAGDTERQIALYVHDKDDVYGNGDAVVFGYDMPEDDVDVENILSDYSAWSHDSETVESAIMINDCRKKMLDSNGSLDWCQCFDIGQEKRVQIVANDEGMITSLAIDGKYVLPEVFYGAGTYTETTLEKVAKMVNPYFEEYQGYTATEIILDAKNRERPCCNCPWFYICDAMDEDY